MCALTLSLFHSLAILFSLFLSLSLFSPLFHIPSSPTLCRLCRSWRWCWRTTWCCLATGSCTPRWSRGCSAACGRTGSLWRDWWRRSVCAPAPNAPPISINISMCLCPLLGHVYGGFWLWLGVFLCVWLCMPLLFVLLSLLLLLKAGSLWERILYVQVHERLTLSQEFD